MFRKAFKKVKTVRRVTAKAIHLATGISQSHISDYINDNADVTTETLESMLKTLEKLSPGAQQDFGKLIAGKEQDRTQDVAEVIRFLLLHTDEVITSMTDKEVSVLLLAIAKRMQSPKKEPAKVKLSKTENTNESR